MILAVVSRGGTALAGGLGFFVSRAAVSPVERLRRAAEEVATTRDLTRRIEARGADELAALASSFNLMLNALESSIDAQRQLVADASHELRTPLASLRTNIDLVDLARDSEREQEPAVSVRLDLVVEQAVERARMRTPTVSYELDARPCCVRAVESQVERAAGHR